MIQWNLLKKHFHKFHEFREDITDAKKSIEETWNEKYKSRNDLFWRYHCNKRLEKLYSSKPLKENPCIPPEFLPNHKETPEKKEIMQNLTKKNSTCRIKIFKKLDMRENWDLNKLIIKLQT